MVDDTVSLPPLVTRDEWLQRRIELLQREKELTKLRDDLNTARRELPMVEIETDYRFVGPDGEASLLDLFEGRDQLIVHHFMWNYDIAPDGTETPKGEGCPSCSATADDIGDLTGLWVRGTTLAAVSRVPIELIEPFRMRMGWTFPWYSSAGSRFNYDFWATVDDRVAPVLLNFRTESDLADRGTPWEPKRRGDYPGISTFVRQGDRVFHTYSTFARGLEQPGGTSAYLDLTVLGRQEQWESPSGRITGRGAGAGSGGLKFHDRYTAEEIGKAGASA